MLKSFQARLQEHVNQELPDVQAGLEKAEEPEIKLPKSVSSWKKQGNSKDIYLCFSHYEKAFDCVDHKNKNKKQTNKQTKNLWRVINIWECQTTISVS